MTVQVYLTILFIIVFITILVSCLMSYHFFKKEFQKRLSPDISVQQMEDSEIRVATFLEKHGLQPGASLEQIAKALNIVDGGEEERIGARAMLHKPDADGKMLATFQKGSTEEEKRFDFAHECGHLINEDPAPVTRPQGHNKAESEQLADYVGAALLLPLDQVYNFLKQNHYQNCSRRKKRVLVKELCRRYGVSELIAVRRINEVYILKKDVIK